MLTVAFSRTDLQLPTTVAVIPKNGFVIFKQGTKSKSYSLLFSQGLPACFVSEYLSVFNIQNVITG